MIAPTSLRTIVSDGRHNAFAGFVKWKGEYWLSHRSGTGHIARDGDVIVRRSTDTHAWDEALRFDILGDDRDPQLLPTASGLRLYINSLEAGQFRAFVSTTDDGTAWSPPRPVYEDGYILWKPVAHDGRFYAAAHRPGSDEHREAHLVTSTDGLVWEKVSTIRAGRGESETTLVFAEDGHLIAFLRSQVTVGGFIMESSPPYVEWQERPAAVHLSGHAAATFDDVLGLFVLAILTAMIEAGSIPDIATLALMLSKVVAFFAIAVALGVHVYPRFSRRLKAMQAAAFEFSALIGVALAYGLLAELLGIHWVLGVFMAGLYFEPARVGRRAYLEIKLIVAAVTGGFLGPLFFASIGLGVDLRAAVTVPGFLALLIAIAVGAKMIGSGLPALWAGMSRRDAAAVGTGMVARGATELVVISIAAEAGLFATGDSSDPVTANLYSALVLMAVVTTLITPILLRLILPAAKDR